MFISSCLAFTVQFLLPNVNSSVPSAMCALFTPPGRWSLHSVRCSLFRSTCQVFKAQFLQYSLFSSSCLALFCQVFTVLFLLPYVQCSVPPGRWSVHSARCSVFRSTYQVLKVQFLQYSLFSSSCMALFVQFLLPNVHSSVPSTKCSMLLLPGVHCSVPSIMC